MPCTQMHVLFAVDLFVDTHDIRELSKSGFLRDIKTHLTVWIMLSTHAAMVFTPLSREPVRLRHPLDVTTKIRLYHHLQHYSVRCFPFRMRCTLRAFALVVERSSVFYEQIASLLIGS